MSFKDTIQLLKNGKNPLKLQSGNGAGLKNVRNIRNKGKKKVVVHGVYNEERQNI